MKKVIFTIILVLTLVIRIDAFCTDKELREYAENAKVKFVEYYYDETKYKTNYGFAYFLTLEDMRDDIKIIGLDGNNISSDAEKYEEIGIYGVGGYTNLEPEVYTIKIYGSEESACPGELLNTLKYEIPAYNDYYLTGYCERNSEHRLCQRFTNETKDMTEKEFKEELREYEESKKVTPNNILKKYWIYIVCIIVPIVLVWIYYSIKIKNYKKIQDKAEIRKRRKKHIRKTMLLIFMLMLTVNVKAASACNVHISDEGIKPSGWSARLRICDWVKTNREITAPAGMSFGLGIEHGEELTETTELASNGKEFNSISVPKCTYEMGGYMSVSIRLEYVKKYDAGTYRNCNGHSPDCLGIFGDDTDDCCGYSTGCNSCSSGDHKTGNGCECSGLRSYTYGVSHVPKNAINTDFRAEARDECNLWSGKTCTIVDEQYTMHCPIYECNPVTPVIDGWCNQTYSVHGTDAYCINPVFEAASGYQEQTFDATSCASSYSSTDCGFANILLESKYYKYSSAVTTLALRLWGAYNDLSGYKDSKGKKTGLAVKQGSTCEDHYTYPAPVTAAYPATLGDVLGLKQFTEFIDLDKNRNPKYNEMMRAFANLKCERVGVACDHDSSDEYKYAVALFYNTKTGNKLMKDHMRELYGGNTEPISVTVESEENTLVEENPTGEDGKSITNKKGESLVLRLTFLEEVTTEGKMIDCDELNSGKYTDEDIKRIEPYCNIKVKNTLYYEDGTWKPLETEGSDVKPEYCIKNQCIVRIKPYALCDLETKKYGVKLVWQNSNVTATLKKYVPCSGGQYQEMLSIEGSGTSSTSTEETGYKEITYFCNSGEGACTDYEIRTSEPTCENDTVTKFYSNPENKDKSYYGRTYTGYVSDPPLNCINNMGKSTEKNSYDYSNYFGVNTDVCRIYCSDEVEYVLADKVKTYNSLSFRYDIEFAAYKSTNISHALTSGIKIKRNCVSKIFYENNEFEDKDLILSKYNIEKANNLKELFSKIKKERTYQSDEYQQLLYDLAQCNLVTPKWEKDLGVKKPRDNTTGNIYTNIHKIYSKENNYGFYKHISNVSDSSSYVPLKLTDSENEVANMKIKYECGAQAIGSKKLIGKDYDDKETNIELNYSLKNNISDLDGSTKDSIIGDVKYCKGSGCFAYNKNEMQGKSKEFDLPDCVHKGGTTTCGSCYGDCDSNISYAGPACGYSSSRSGKCINTSNMTSGQALTNDYAYFTITTQIDFYNNSRFEVENYTGNVQKVTGGESKLLPLARYNYPVNNAAYSMGENGRCKVTQKTSEIGTYYRKQVYNADPLVQVLNGKKVIVGGNRLGEFTCYVDTTCWDCPVPECVGNECPNPKTRKNEVVYRNVDISNIFPNDLNGDEKEGLRTSGLNWLDEKGKLIPYVGEVEKYVEDNGTAKYYNTHLEYSFTLNQDAIKKIREYNKDNSYTDNSLTGCDAEGLNCKSSFITEILQTNEYGIKNNRELSERGVSEYTSEKIKGGNK